MKNINPLTLIEIQNYWEEVVQVLSIPEVSLVEERNRTGHFFYDNLSLWESEEQLGQKIRIRRFGFPFKYYHPKLSTPIAICFMFNCTVFPNNKPIIEIENLDDIATLFTDEQCSRKLCLSKGTRDMVKCLIEFIENDCFSNYNFPEFLSRFTVEYERNRALKSILN